MALDYDQLMSWPFAEITTSYEERDCIFYALCLGLGSEPSDPHHLRFVYERDLVVLPTFGLTLGIPGPFLADPRTGVDYRRAVHGEHSFILHRPLGPSGQVVTQNRIAGVVDKGAGRGALVFVERETIDAESREPLVTQAYTIFCRGDGGFGGPTGPSRVSRSVPESQHDATFSWRTLPQASLLYRLQGDWNPLHADPETAADAGFPRPIIHGLCTFGVAGLGLTALLCDWDAQRLRRMDGRLTAPLFPGETIEVRTWQVGPHEALFRAVCVERGITVLDNGYCEFNEATAAA